MNTIDERLMHAPADTCFTVAADVERWPALLPHYRWVRFLSRDGFGTGTVEMAAWRVFAGPVRYPTRWISEMSIDTQQPVVRYTHIGGITRGMAVEWRFEPRPEGTHVCITHEWVGPGWPLIGRFAADRIIGPHFVSAIAQRTLAGVAAEAERRASAHGHEAGQRARP